MHSFYDKFLSLCFIFAGTSILDSSKLDLNENMEETLCCNQNNNKENHLLIPTNPQFHASITIPPSDMQQTIIFSNDDDVEMTHCFPNSNQDNIESDLHSVLTKQSKASMIFNVFSK